MPATPDAPVEPVTPEPSNTRRNRAPLWIAPAVAALLVVRETEGTLPGASTTQWGKAQYLLIVTGIGVTGWHIGGDDRPRLLANPIKDWTVGLIREEVHW